MLKKPENKESAFYTIIPNLEGDASLKQEKTPFWLRMFGSEPVKIWNIVSDKLNLDWFIWATWNNRGLYVRWMEWGECRRSLECWKSSLV